MPIPIMNIWIPIIKRDRIAYKTYLDAYKVYKQAKQDVDHLQENMSERARELDMLRYQIDEIEDAGLHNR